MPEATRSRSNAAVVDPRGQRFTASVNLLGFALALALGDAHPGVAATILAVLAVAFAVMVLVGPAEGPWGRIFKAVLRPRLGPPRELEDAAPPRFAALIGLIFTVIGLIGYLSGATLLGAIATGIALVAAFLNAVFGFCIGCEFYLLGRRITSPATR